MSEKYYLGLDIGTNDVGWAVLDENYNLVRKNKFTLWGVRMFDEAMDASDRRMFRSQRRRTQRRKQRIDLLRGLFKNEIDKVDPDFYQCLDDSFFKFEDKKNPESNYLFKDVFTDKDFFDKYPTIFHLRKDLISKDEKADIRFIYLALHHIIKYRGNFLSGTDEIRTGDLSLIKEIFNDFDSIIDELNELFIDDENYNSDCFVKAVRDENFFEVLKSILASNDKLKEKKEALEVLFNVPKKSLYNEFLIPLLTKNELSNLSSLSLVKSKKYDKCKISLDVENLESALDEIKLIVPELNLLIEFCNRVKIVVDYFYLSRLLKDSNSISEAMVNVYNQHQKDLKDLKEFFKKHASNKYYECFRKVDPKLNNYAKYVGRNDTSSKMKRFAHCSRTDFYSYLESIFKTIEDSEAMDQIEYFRERISNGTFMPKQNSNQNGVIPMQLNYKELVDILDKQKKYYSFLLDTDADGIKVEDKIKKIFLFKLPYYVGPLNRSSNYSWVIRNNNKVTPWNFEKVVNLDETAKEFILRMQNKCTYLKGENDYCLPKNSLVFSEYNCLSYLNKISINGKLLSYEDKMLIFNNVFLIKKKPTKKDIICCLKTKYGSENITTSTSKELPEVNCDMSSYIIFKEIFGVDFNNKKDVIENIIRDIVIFEDKDQLMKRLYEVYNLETDAVKKIKGLNFKGYGSLCMNLLISIKLPDIETGEEVLSVLDVMRNTNMNLQEILYDEKYKLIDRIDEYNKKYLSKDEELSLEEFVDENIFVSPIMKRPLIQTYRIIEDVEKILGHKIDKYFVECTRTNKGDKKATKSRYEKIKDLYSKCNELSLDFQVNLKELKTRLEDNKDKLKSDSIYLYFTQLGKCMYTLEDIDFSKLSIEYDIDHIYPQSLIKDDSLSNRVLTKKTFNNGVKGDKALFELDNQMPKGRVVFYQKLLDLDLISREKFKRLTKKSFSSDELEGFVNRQLVATNQSVKGIVQVLKSFKGVNTTDIIYSKAENVSMFRQLFDIPKSRTANNFHHAHDAYLNVIVGDVLNKYYSINNFYGYKDYLRLRNENITINPEKVFSKNEVIIKGKTIWNKDGLIGKIKNDIFNRFDIHETFRTYVSNAMYSKTTILPAGNDGTVSVKTSNALSNAFKYGGITSNSFGKYVLIKNTKSNVDEYILEAIPKRYELFIDTYLKSIGYTNYEIINKDIRTNILVEENGLKYVITGKSNDSYLLKNANDRFFDIEDIKTIKAIDKFIENKKLGNSMIVNQNDIVVSPVSSKGNEIKITKASIDKLIEALKNMYKKEIFNFNLSSTLFEKLSQIDSYSLDLVQSIYLISELLNLLKTNERKSANLTQIGLAKSFGIITHNKKFVSGCKFITESPTGYYRTILFEVP